jgi:hypothetical protein
VAKFVVQKVVRNSIIKETCAFIIDGGKSFCITKNLKDGDISYTFVKLQDLKYFTFTIEEEKDVGTINKADVSAIKEVLKKAKKKKKLVRVSLATILSDKKHEISYDHVVFEPYVYTYNDFVQRNKGNVFNLGPTQKAVDSGCLGAVGRFWPRFGSTAQMRK